MFRAAGVAVSVVDPFNLALGNEAALEAADVNAIVVGEATLVGRGGGSQEGSAGDDSTRDHDGQLAGRRE